MPEVSVIIPVYNVEKYLEKCLDSIINQTLKDIEIICINDCSTDSSLKILQAHAAKDTRIKIMDFKENKGASAARNEGIKLANGKYIGFVDSDDWIDLDFYEKLYNTAEEDDCDITKAQLRLVFPEKDKEENSRLNFKISTNKLYFCYEFCSAIYKNAFLKKHNLIFPEKILTFEDPIFSINAILCNPALKLINDTNYHYLIHSTGLSKNNSKQILLSLLDGIKTLIDILNNANISKNDYLLCYYNLIFQNFYSHYRNIKDDCIQKLIFGKFQKILSDNLKYQDEILPNRALEELYKDFINKFQRKDIVQGLRKSLKSHIPIFLSSDNNYAPFVATTIASICDNTESFVDFYILDSGITPENRIKIESLKNRFNNFSIEFIEINTKKHFENINYRNKEYISLSTYNRFLIPQIKQNLNKVIYLDVDIIVLGDIKELYNINLENYALGAAWDKTRILYNTDTQIPMELSKDYRYFNAGILLIDIQKWNQDDIIDKLLSIEKQYSNKILHADETLLNKYFDLNYKIFDIKYNYTDYDVINSPNIKPVIRHFASALKPWNANYFFKGKQVMPLKNFDDFWKYAAITQFYDTIKELYNNSINSNIFTKRMNKLVVNIREKQYEQN